MKSGSYSTVRLFLALAVVSVLALLVLGACAPAATPAPSNSITDIDWQWTTLKDQGTVTTVPNPENYTLILRPDNTLSGTADCNVFGGTYSQENGFSITLGATTMAFCGEESLDQQYLRLLGSVAAGGPDGAGGLALETAGGAQRMEFKNGGPAPKP